MDSYPSSWKQMPICVLANTYAGGTPSRSVDAMFGGKIPWVKSTELNQGIILRTDESLTERGYRSSSVKWVPEKTPLVAMYGATAGVVGWLDIRAVTNQAVLAVVPYESTNSRWLYWALSYHTAKLLAAVQGSGQPNLSKTLIDKVQLYCPPLPEQRRIAEILDAADAAIRETERVIAKLRQVKRGLLHDLLTRGLDESGHLRDPDAHPEGFKDSPLGRIPRGWEVIQLEDVAGKITSGSRGWASYYSDQGPLFLRIGNLTRERLTPQLDEVVHVRPPVGSEGTRTEVKAGDILISITADLGIVGVVPEDFGKAYVNQHISLVSIPSSKLNQRWVGYYLAGAKAGQRQFSRLDDMGAKSGMNLSAVGALLVALPSRKEQNAITAILDAHAARIRAEEAVLAKRRQLKRGLMDDLLTGRVRV